MSFYHKFYLFDQNKQAYCMYVCNMPNLKFSTFLFTLFSDHHYIPAIYFTVTGQQLIC